MTDELQQTVDRHLDEAVESGAGVSEETEEHFERGYDIVKNASDMTMHCEVGEVEDLYEMATNLAEGEEVYEMPEVAATAYGGVRQFVNAVEKAGVNEETADAWRSTGRAVIDSIATVYEASDGRVHDAIFSSSGEKPQKYADALMGEGDSQRLLGLVDYTSPKVEAQRQAEEKLEENREILDRKMDEK
jgi:hypothetical protein